MKDLMYFWFKTLYTSKRNRRFKVGKEEYNSYKNLVVAATGERHNSDRVHFMALELEARGLDGIGNCGFIARSFRIGILMMNNGTKGYSCDFQMY